MKAFINNSGYEIKSIWNNKFNIIRNITAVIGSITSLYKMMEITGLTWINKYIDGIDEKYWLLLSGMVILYNINKFRPIYQYKYAVKRIKSEVSVTLKMGDIFSSTETMIIPVNTAFDTSFHNDIINSESVQGKFQKMFFRDNVTDLDKQIADSLKEKNIAGESIDRRLPMKNIRFPLGAIAEINFRDKENKRKAYFLASSDTNFHSKAENVNLSNYMAMLGAFWLNMSKYGHTEDDIVMPVPCSGNAGIAESLDKLVTEIVNSYITISQEYILTRNLTIYIYPKELKARQLSFEEIAKHVEAVCRY